MSPPGIPLGFFSPVAVFDPSSIPDMVYWFDPSDASTVTLVAGDIDIIADKTGNWALYAGGVAARMPLVETINGLNAARYHFFPDTDYLRIADAAITYYPTWDQIYASTYSWTHFVVLESVGNAGAASNSWSETGIMGQDGYNDIVVSSTAVAPFPQTFVCYSYAQCPPVDLNVSFAEPAGPGVPMQLMSQQNYPGLTPATSNLSGSRDGGALVSSLGCGMWSGAYTIYQGRGWSGAPATTYFDGRVGECLSYKRELTAGEVALVTDYLKVKWGLP